MSSITTQAAFVSADATLAKDGFKVIDVASSQQAFHYRQQFDAVEQSLGFEAMKQAHLMTSKMIFDSPYTAPFIWSVASNQTLLDAIEQELGPNLLLLNNSSFFVKYGQQDQSHSDPGKFVAWHQDLRYMQLEPSQMITAWYAIDDTAEDNGCLRLVPGSHHNGIYEHKMTANNDNMLNNKQEAILTAEVQEKQARLCPLQAGQAVLFSGWLLHGSPSNVSSRRRAGLSLRFVSTQSKCDHRMISRAILMRGTDKHQHYKLQPAPKFEGVS